VVSFAQPEAILDAIGTAELMRLDVCRLNLSIALDWELDAFGNLNGVKLANPLNTIRT